MSQENSRLVGLCAKPIPPEEIPPRNDTSDVSRWHEDAGEAGLCAKPIPPKEIPPGNDISVVSNECAGKAGLKSHPIPPGEVNVIIPHENLVVSSQCHIVQGNQNEPERIEDVFQDDIIRRFGTYQSFKQFALAGTGLGLSQYVVQTIEEDNYQSVENKKLDLLNKWLERNNGPDAVKKIKEIVNTHIHRLASR